MIIPRNGLRILTALTILCGLILSQVSRPAFSANFGPASITSALSVGQSASLPGGYTETLLAKAQPDECFNGIGNPYPAGPPCVTGQSKVNQSYVWGLTRSGNTLWFGTAANPQCLVMGILNQNKPIVNSSYACEYGKSQQSQNLGMPAGLGDWRPPHVYSYDLTTKTLTDRTSQITTATGGPLQTLGLRSAGALSGTIFLAGPSFQNSGKSIDLYAFSDAGSLLGYWNLTQYDNVRRWLVVNGALYLGVHNAAGGGSILRWNGTFPATNGTVSDASTMFDTVGTVTGDAADLALYNNRIFVSTWGDASHATGLWMSPTVPLTGLTSSDAANWTQVWTVKNYEPDPVTANAYFGGALASFGGYLYWGTMHVPLLATESHFRAYGNPTTGGEALTDLQNTWRAIAVFRGSNFGSSSQNVQLLYGESKLPAWVPGTGWESLSTNAGTPLFGTQSSTPLYGKSGFGNKFNNYTWSMDVYNNQLFVGTMDWSYLYPDFVNIIAGSGNLASLILLSLSQGAQPGADLVRFPSAAKAAVAVSTTGLGNATSYGVRNLIGSTDGLYAGMANPMNLLTRAGKPMGGWELIKIK